MSSAEAAAKVRQVSPVDGVRDSTARRLGAELPSDATGVIWVTRTVPKVENRVTWACPRG